MNSLPGELIAHISTFIDDRDIFAFIQTNHIMRCNANLNIKPGEFYKHIKNMPRV